MENERESISQTTNKRESILQATNKRESILQETNKRESILQATNKRESILQETNKRESILQATNKRESSILQATNKHASILQATNKRDSIESQKDNSHENLIIARESDLDIQKDDDKNIIDIPYDFCLLDKAVVDFRNEMLKQTQYIRREDMRKGDDHIDINEHPSLTTLKEPYSQICRLRYEQNWRKYNKQFLREIKIMELLQQNAYETARYARILCYTTLWPPLHNRQETNKFIKKYFVHTPKDKARLRYLLNSPQI